MKSLRYSIKDEVEESDIDPTPDDYGEDPNPLIWCPYCGGRGDAAWFETHEHVNPFGDDEQ